MSPPEKHMYVIEGRIIRFYVGDDNPLDGLLGN